MSIERLRKAVAPQTASPEPATLRAQGESPSIFARQADEPFLGISPLAFAAAGGVWILTLLVFILGTA